MLPSTSLNSNDVETPPQSNSGHSNDVEISQASPQSNGVESEIYCFYYLLCRHRIKIEKKGFF